MNDLLRSILMTSLIGSILTICIFLINKLFKKLSFLFQYYIWILIIVLLIIPLNFTFPVKYQATKIVNTQIPILTVKDIVDEIIPIEQSMNVVNQSDNQNRIQSEKTSIDFATTSIYIWFLGIVAYLLWNVFDYLKFIKILRLHDLPAKENELNILKMLKVTSVRLVRNGVAATPMLVGLFKPVIIIPDQEFTDTQIANILMHELIHLSRYDILVKWIVMFVHAIHWFNPFVYVIHDQINKTCELSCDELVIRNLDAKGKQSYGETLISVMAQHKQSFGVLSTTMCEDKKILKERLESIMQYKKKSNWIKLVSMLMVVSIVLGACALETSTKNALSDSGMVQTNINTSYTNEFLADKGYTDQMLQIIKGFRDNYNKNTNSKVDDAKEIVYIVESLPIPDEGYTYGPININYNQQNETLGLEIHYENNMLTNPAEFRDSIYENNAALLFLAYEDITEIELVFEVGEYSVLYLRENVLLNFKDVSLDKIGDVKKALVANFKMKEYNWSHWDRYYLGVGYEQIPNRQGVDPDEYIEYENGLIVATYNYENGYSNSFYFVENTMIPSHDDGEPSSTMMIAKVWSLKESTETYKDVLIEYGPADYEANYDKKHYVSYQFALNENELYPEITDKWAFFVFENNQLTESGIIMGNDYPQLFPEK